MRLRRLGIVLALLATATTVGLPRATASSLSGAVTFKGVMNLGSTMPAGSLVPPSPTAGAGSGETFPVSGGNETCGRNNTDGGIWSTYVPDPLVDEVGFCRGTPGTLLPALTGSSGSSSISVGSEPPDICRGTLVEGSATSGHVCTMTSAFGSWSGNCTLHSGEIYLNLIFSGPAGSSTVSLALDWVSPAGGVAPVTGNIAYSGGVVTGTLTFVPRDGCTGGTTSFDVIGDLVFAEST